MYNLQSQDLYPALKLHRLVLLYFDENDVFTEIEKSAMFYKTVEDKAYHFIIPVDPSSLLDLSVQLGMSVLMNPIAASLVFQEVVFCAITSLKLLPQCTSLSQVVVNFKLMSLPRLPGYHLYSAGELRIYKKEHRFLGFKGIVIGKSILHKYTKSARFVCPVNGCEGHIGNKFIRLHTAGALEMQMIRNDFTCTYCYASLVEDISCRVLADKYLVEVVDENAFISYIREKTLYQALMCHVIDDLVQEVEIGQTLDLIGIPVQDFHHQTVALEVNNILAPNPVTEHALGEDGLPLSVKKLYNDRRSSPWSFALSLAYAFASEVCSVGTFVHLKLGLLLSLVGAGNQGVGMLDVLAVGSDTLLLKRLLCHAATYCDRSVLHSQSHHLTALVTKERGGSGAPFIEGGSILLSGDGICVIPDLHCYKKQKMNLLLQVLETNHVFVDVPASPRNPTRQQLFLPRRCRVWGSCESVLSKTRSMHPDQLMNTVQQEEVEPALADGFGQVFFCDVKAGSYAECLLQNSCLMAAIGVPTSSVISTEDFKQFIDFAKEQCVEFEPEAEEIIRSYYVASRRLRSSCVESSITLPVNAVKTITSMAKAHTKLSLRKYVTEFDATVAVLLFEEQMTFRSGYSLFNVTPLIHFPDSNIHEHLGSKLDERMSHFYQTLKHFISTNMTSDRVTEE